LIVTCQECSTSFQLDDARIPVAGARVRCSRCKHAFFLPNPSASQSEAVESVVEQAIQGRSASSPEPAQDLGKPSADKRAPAPARHEPEEEEWQFSEEIRVAGDDDADEAELARSPRPDSFDLTGDFGAGFDPETLSREAAAKPLPAATHPATHSATKPATHPATALAAGPAAASSAAPNAKPAAVKPAAAAPAEKRDESSFGSIDDFSSLIEDVSIELATDTAKDTRRTPARSAKPAARVGSNDDLGDPESWDLVGPEAARPARAAAAPTTRPAAVAKKKQTAATLELFGAEELPPIHDEADASSSAIWERLAPLGSLAGWGVTLACIAFVGNALLRPEWLRWAEVTQRIEQAPFVAETGSTGWLATSRAGFLLVVEGELRNTGSHPARPVKVDLALLDRAGVRLATPPIPVGRPLAESVLRESKPEELTAQVEQAVAAFAGTPLVPGETRRFTAIARADQVPDTARRILLEAGSPDSP